MTLTPMMLVKSHSRPEYLAYEVPAPNCVNQYIIYIAIDRGTGSGAAPRAGAAKYSSHGAWDW